MSYEFFVIFSPELTQVPFAVEEFIILDLDQMIVDVEEVSFVIDRLKQALFPFALDLDELLDF